MVALDNSFGALLIGVVTAAILYGFAYIQTWYYFTQYSSDPWYLKLLVAAVLISETCNQALITHTIYTSVITNFGVWERVGNITWSLVASIFFNAFTILLVQCFLVMRVYKLSNKSWLTTSPAMIFVIAQFVAVTTLGIKVSGFRTHAEIASKLNGLSMASATLAAVGDVVIAGFLCYLLHVSRTGFRRSDTMISKLIVFSINTGLLTSLCALSSLICMSLWPDALIYITFYCCADRLYWNCLLATLNTRKRLRGGSHEDDMSLSLHDHGTQQRTSHSTIGASSRRIPNNISIKIDTTQDCLRDEYSSSGGDVKHPGAF